MNVQLGSESIFIVALIFVGSVISYSTEPCGDSQFQCLNSKCVLKNKACDGQNDCGDDSDEINCGSNTTCFENEFACASGKCIVMEYVCDKDNDCEDNSDETERACEVKTCPENEFQCKDKTCIKREYYCDGVVECEDESDEPIGCQQTSNSKPVCKENQFHCHDHNVCIEKSKVCDGNMDCKDGSDEHKCLRMCEEQEFQCVNFQCLPMERRCNGKFDCADSSDEQNCQKCDHNEEFYCHVSNECINASKVCDGEVDCKYEEDEDVDKCNVDECSVNNGNCSQICTDLVIGHRCSCENGFKLKDSICIDINECLIPGTCSQRCYNTIGSFKCSCVQGYFVDPQDSTRCKASDGDPLILFATIRDIRLIDVNSLQSQTLIRNIVNAFAINFDIRQNIIYWTDILTETISAGSTNETRVIETIISENIHTPAGISVDWVAGNVYWTDNDRKTIEVVHGSGGMRKVLFNSSIESPKDIVVNPLTGWMFWTDWGDKNAAKIEKAGMDGSQRVVIIDSNLKWPSSLTLDFVGERIFWTNAKQHKLWSSDYNGQNKKFITFLKREFPFSIDVFEDLIYWTDWSSRFIHKVNKFTGKKVDSIFIQDGQPMDIHVYHKNKQPTDVDLLKSRKKCSHFALRTPKKERYLCYYPNDLTLDKDLKETGLDTFVIEESVTVTKCANQTETVKSPAGNVDKTRRNKLTQIMIASGILVGLLIGLCSLMVITVHKRNMRKKLANLEFHNSVYYTTTEEEDSVGEKHVK